jgi:pimeloyl-ACP methyl ester carboxylesterase
MHFISRLVVFIGGLTLRFMVYSFVALATFVTVCTLRVPYDEVDERHHAAPSGGHFVRVADVELYAQTAGKSTDPLVIILHGMAAWSETWRPVMESVAKDGYYVVAVDMPPFGYSERPVDKSFWRTSGAARLRALIQFLRPQGSALVVAHSYGSRAAVELALTSPELVSGIVLVDPALDGIYGDATTDHSLLTSILSKPTVQYVLSASTVTNPLLSKKLLQQFMYRKNQATDEVVSVYERPSSLKDSTKDFGSWIAGFMTNADVGMSSDPHNYAQLSLPSALIWGAEDTTTPIEQGFQLRHLIKDADLMIMPAVGHMPQLENPEVFKDYLSKAIFLISHSSKVPAAVPAQ